MAKKNPVRTVTLEELLNYLDGNGLVITNDELLEKSLEEYGVSEQALVELDK